MAFNGLLTSKTPHNQISLYEVFRDFRTSELVRYLTPRVTPIKAFGTPELNDMLESGHFNFFAGRRLRKLIKELEQSISFRGADYISINRLSTKLVVNKDIIISTVLNDLTNISDSDGYVIYEASIKIKNDYLDINMLHKDGIHFIPVRVINDFSVEVYRNIPYP